MFAFKIVAIVFCSIAFVFPNLMAAVAGDDVPSAMGLVNTVVLALAIVALACSL